MRFYQECVAVAESVGALLDENQRRQFAECKRNALQEYQLTLGMWIRNHLLPHNPYLRGALEVLGLVTPQEMSWYLIAFAQQYWKLKRADLI